MEKLTRNRNRVIRENVECVICEGKTARALYRYSYNDRDSEILQCSGCGHLFLYPVPLVELKERTMDTIADAEFCGNTLFQWLHEHVVIQKEIRYAKKFLHTAHSPRLLDIGCGTGWTTAIWQKNGFSATGLEPSQSRSKIARETYGIRVSNQHIEEFSTDELFDVVILRHLLEHIEDPDRVLRRIRSFLKSDGLLLIIIPNIHCIGRYIFREHWAWILPWHLHFYTPWSLMNLIRKMDYQKLKLYQMPSPLWYPASIQSFLGVKTIKHFPTSFSLLLCSPIIFLGFLLNMNDNMTLICRNSKET